MNGFDFANAAFIWSGDGPWELDRDWSQHPATPLEVEALFARLMLVDRLLYEFVLHFADGEMQIADGLDDTAFEKVMRWVAAVREVMLPPAEGAE